MEKKLSYASISKSKDGITHVELEDKTILDENNAMELMTVVSEINSNEQALVLTDLRSKNIEGTKGGRKFLANNPIMSQTIRANAVIMNTNISILALNFFMKVNKPSFPIKLFKTEEKAIEWLKTF